jgi:hypothetical protein
VIKSTNRYLSKQERDYVIEITCIKYIRKLAKTHDSIGKLELFEEMENEVRELLQDENERVILEYFDLPAWIHSKRERIKFDEAVRAGLNA